MFAALTLDFEPTIAPFGLTVRLETLALALVIMLVVIAAAIGAGRMRDVAAETGAEPPRLRRDDLLLIAFGAVPGAVVGARIEYGLIHYDYFSQDFGRLLDPAQGGLSLTLAVLLGTLSATAVALLLSAPISRWLHVATTPLLLGLGLGKLAMILGADGQGEFSDSSWAVSFSGPGQWMSANPAAPALPSQALEAVLVLGIVLAILVVPAILRLRLDPGRPRPRLRVTAPPRIDVLSGHRRFLTAMLLWLAARFAATTTWRDAQVLGPFKAEQLILISVFVPLLILSVVAWRLDVRRRRRAAGEATPPEPRTPLESRTQPEPVAPPEPLTPPEPVAPPEPRTLPVPRSRLGPRSGSRPRPSR